MIKVVHGLYDYNCICEMYNNGELTIEQVIEGYQVTIQEASGGISIILVDEIG